MACQVVPLTITEGGRYPGTFQGGSFDRYEVRVTGDFDLRLETTGDAGECPADTLISVTSDALNEALSNDDIDEDSACSMLEVPAEDAVYAVEVRGGETAPADESVAYVLVVDILELCTLAKANAQIHARREWRLSSPSRVPDGGPQRHLCLRVRVRGGWVRVSGHRRVMRHSRSVPRWPAVRILRCL